MFGTEMVVFDVRTMFFTFMLMSSVLYLQNIMKYLLSEAKEKEQASFQKGWKINIIKVDLLTTSKCIQSL